MSGKNFSGELYLVVLRGFNQIFFAGQSFDNSKNWKKVVVKSKIILALVSLVVSSVVTIYSLNYMEWRAAEEAAIAYFGFPFSMRETGAFYGGYGGQLVGEGGRDFVLQSSITDEGLKPDWTGIALSKNLKTDWKGVWLNLICDTLASLLVMFNVSKILKKIRRSTA
jgi:hypothetical protein